LKHEHLGVAGKDDSLFFDRFLSFLAFVN
jgi:hypothetical protein